MSGLLKTDGNETADFGFIPFRSAMACDVRAAFASGASSARAPSRKTDLLRLCARIGFTPPV